MLICQVCDHEAVPYDSEKGIVGEAFPRISWELVNISEYAARIKDGRTSRLDVCPDCYEQFTGIESKSIGTILHELNEARKQESKKKSLQKET